jgi:hypothetical protein
LLGKLFVIVEIVALRWARPSRSVVELESLAKRRDLFMRLSQISQHPAVPRRVWGQKGKRGQKRKIICVDLESP